MKKNLLKMALLAFATFAASVASAQTYSGKITSSDWSGDNGLESDVDYSLTYIESTKKLNFEFTVPCDKKIINAYFFAEYGFSETKIEVPQSVDGTYTLSGTTVGAFAFEKGHETWFFFKLTIEGVGDIVTNNIAYKAGEGNATEVDTEAPEWGVDPVAQNVTDKAAEIVVNVTDDSGSAVITLTGDNGFAELKKEVKADGSNQTIALNGLTANTTYNLTLAIADAAGNAGESKTVNFTTLETPDREVLYHSFNFTSENWTKYGKTNTFAPNGRLLLTVNADNTVTVKVTVDEGVEAVEFVEFILHGIDAFRINVQEDGSFVGTSTKSISNRDASQAFNMNFVLKNGVGNSVFEPLSFTPSEGSTSAVAEVETEVAKVVAANGVIRVEGDKTFAVYTVAGQLAFRGMGEVRLDKGVYVVVVDGKAQKVML